MEQEETPSINKILLFFYILNKLKKSLFERFPQIQVYKIIKFIKKNYVSTCFFFLGLLLLFF